MFEKEVSHVLEADRLTDCFQELEEKLQYKHWYFGYYHKDLNIDRKHKVLYFGMIG